MTVLQLLLPEEERSSLHSERIHRRLESMLLPEDQNLKLLSGFVGEHTVPTYRPVVAGHESSEALE